MAHQSLKQLRRDHPTRELMPDVLEEIGHGSDRAVALVLVAYLDHALKDGIANRLARYKGNDNNVEAAQAKLFEDRGALYTFDAKISVAHALWLFGDVTRRNLDVIRSVRNTFAHSAMPVSFKTPAILALCKQLQRVPRRYRLQKSLKFRTGRDRYVTTALEISAMVPFVGAIDHPSLRKWPEEVDAYKPLP